MRRGSSRSRSNWRTGLATIVAALAVGLLVLAGVTIAQQPDNDSAAVAQYGPPDDGGDRRGDRRGNRGGGGDRGKFRTRGMRGRGGDGTGAGGAGAGTGATGAGTTDGATDPNDPTAACRALDPELEPSDRAVSSDKLKGADRRVVKGTKRDDVIIVGPLTEVIKGLAGNDVLCDLPEGTEILFVGGSGDDNVYAGSGDDRLRGGKGDDDLYAGLGPDMLNGGVGSNTCHNVGGDDRTKKCEIMSSAP